VSLPILEIGDRLVSGLDHTLELEPSRPVRRLEVNGIGGRRRWPVNDKARSVEETLAPGTVVSEIARRHGLTPQQLFRWRHDARRSAKVGGDIGAPRFVPAVVEQPLGPGRQGPRRSWRGTADLTRPSHGSATGQNSPCGRRLNDGELAPDSDVSTSPSIKSARRLAE